MNVAIYARVSTVGTGQSPESQLRELRDYCQRRGWNLVGEYVDAGVSGAKDSRPELNRLMADAHRRHFDVVACWKFDRFARSVSHLLRALDTFKALGIEFVSSVGIARYGYSRRKNGFHGAGCCGGARTQPDSRESQGRDAERQSQGPPVRAEACRRRLRQTPATAQGREFL
jgi:hypothetical protein